MNKEHKNNPKLDMEELWEKDLLQRYPEPEVKAKEDYRNYDNPQRDTVREFYRLNHTYQSYDFVMANNLIRLRPPQFFFHY